MSAIIRNTPRLLALTAAIAAVPAFAAGNAPLSAEERANELEQRLLILERKLELQGEDLAAKAKDAPTVSAGDKGFSIKKGDYSIKFSALAQFDYRTFLSDDPVTGTTSAKPQDGFLARRIRPTISGDLGKLVSFRFTPEFAGTSGLGELGGTSGNTIVDAYADLKFAPYASLRVGKQKGPLGIERLQSGANLPFIERGLTTELVPNRDIGVALFGEAAKGTVNYSVGVFNGTADGRDVSTSDDSRKELEGRVFFSPFKNDYSPLAGLGFGIAGSYGDKHSADGNTANANNTLARYRSYGQQQFFGYNAGVVAEGKHTRLAPQLSFFNGGFGLVADYVSSAQNVAASAATTSKTAKIRNDAYSATATYVLTGEDASYSGINPANPFVLGAPGWGAFELALRHGKLDVDNKVFSTANSTGVVLANPNSSASEARQYGIGVNWYLNRNLKLSADYNQTAFTGGAAGGADRDTEKALFTRVQISY